MTSAAIAYEDAGEHTRQGQGRAAAAVARGAGGGRGRQAGSASRGWRRRSSGATATCGWSRSCSTARWSAVRRGWWRCPARPGSASRGCGASSPTTSTAWPSACCGIGPVPVLRRRGGLLGAGRDGPPAAGDRRGRTRPRMPARSWRRDWSAGCPTRPTGSSSRRGWGRCWGWREPGSGPRGAVRRLAAVLRAPGRARAGGRWCSRTCSGPTTGCWTSSSSCWTGPRQPDLHPHPGAAGAGRRVARDGRPGAAARRLLQLEPLERCRRCAQLLDGLVDGLPAAAAERIIAQARGRPAVRDRDRPGAGRPRRAGRARRAAGAGRRARRAGRAGEPGLAAGRAAGRAGARRSAGWSRRCRCSAGRSRAPPRRRWATCPTSSSTRCWRAWCASRCWRSAPTRCRPIAASTRSRRTLLRTVAYEMLSRQERKPRHLAAAEHLRQRVPQRWRGGGRGHRLPLPGRLPRRAAMTPTPTSCATRRWRRCAARRSGPRRSARPRAAERAYLTAGELAGDEARAHRPDPAAGGDGDAVRTL